MLTSKIMAHRGLSSLAPENSLSALRRAAELGCQWVEIDAVACGDGTIVMWHDNSVDRCSDGIGLLSEHNAKSITTLDCALGSLIYFEAKRWPPLKRRSF